MCSRNGPSQCPVELGCGQEETLCVSYFPWYCSKHLAEGLKGGEDVFLFLTYNSRTH